MPTLQASQGQTYLKAACKTSDCNCLEKSLEGWIQCSRQGKPWRMPFAWWRPARSGRPGLCTETQTPCLCCCLAGLDSVLLLTLLLAMFPKDVHSIITWPGWTKHIQTCKYSWRQLMCTCVCLSFRGSTALLTQSSALAAPTSECARFTTGNLSNEQCQCHHQAKTKSGGNVLILSSIPAAFILQDHWQSQCCGCKARASPDASRVMQVKGGGIQDRCRDCQRGHGIQPSTCHPQI